MLKEWRNCKIGDPVIYETREFDGHYKAIGSVTEVHEDHLIVEADGMHLWVDDNNINLFAKKGEKGMSKKYYVLNEGIDPTTVYGQYFGACIDEETLESIKDDFDGDIVDLFHEASAREIAKYGTVDKPKADRNGPCFAVIDISTNGSVGDFETLEEAIQKAKESKEKFHDRGFWVIDQNGDFVYRN